MEQPVATPNYFELAMFRFVPLTRDGSIVKRSCRSLFNKPVLSHSDEFVAVRSDRKLGKPRRRQTSYHNPVEIFFVNFQRKGSAYY